MADFDIKQTSDVIIEEARRIKAALAESMNYDIDRILVEARKKQLASGRSVVSPPKRQVQ
jgi:hypothetical protein